MALPITAALLAAALAAGEPPAAPPPEPELALRRPALLDSRPATWGLAFLEGPVGYNVLQNLVARTSSQGEVYRVTLASWGRNLRGPWWYDEDRFATNQFGHPYQGSVYFTASRSLGLDFYQSFLVSEVGSLAWEVLGEKEPPSVNDQITTPIAGSFLGEVLYRLSTRVIESSPRGIWRELGAAAVSPAHGLNRAIFGDGLRPRGLNDQPWVGTLKLSLSAGGRATNDGVRESTPGGKVALALHAQNGNPGGDWVFRRPFDHYDAAASVVLDENAVGEKAYANLLIRGLILASRSGEGRSSGLWGLMAGYDFVSPGAFRASSSSLSLGTVGQVLLAGDLALQGTASAGLGYGAGGSSAERVGRRDYHFGAQAVSTLEAKLLWAGRGALRFTGKTYYISSRASPETDSFETIGYGDVELTARVWGPHALSVSVVGATRRARYADGPDVRSRASNLLVSWVLVNDPGFGIGR